MAAAQRVQVAGVGKTRTEELRRKRDREKRRTVITEVRPLGEEEGGEEGRGQGEQPAAAPPTASSGQPPAATTATAAARLSQPAWATRTTSPTP